LTGVSDFAIIIIGSVVKCSLNINFSDFEEIFKKILRVIWLYQPKYFFKNLPKYEDLDQNGIWRQILRVRSKLILSKNKNKK
jgi:ABC-type polysaccharide/polyol phosphate export permease